jgi:hypothetical protein
MGKALGTSLALALVAAAAGSASAFCGFYVAAATGELYNDSSQVVIARNGDRTTLSMFNNYRGDPKEFALVVPVPPGIKKEDVKVIDAKMFAELDKWSAPRLVEYWEQDPCFKPRPMKMPSNCPMCGGSMPTPTSVAPPRDLGVKVEAEFSVGEYDILVLSAKESTGLETWLRQNKYNIPAGAAAILKPYVESKIQFFVAKVNLKRLAETPGRSTKDGVFLSPLSFGYKAKTVALPIKLGMINGRGVQDLMIFMISMKGRFQVTNYANPKVPTDIDVPETMMQKGKFGAFYLKMFDKELAKHDGKAVFTEYAWQSGACDPCAADPISAATLQALGMGDMSNNYQPAFITRLHARYSKETFTKDLEFDETSDQSTFQGRYIVRHPWRGKVSCKNPRRGVWGGSPNGGGGMIGGGPMPPPG